jgi:hypothetical protein
MRELVCKLMGHKPLDGPLQRSPYTVFTHWRDCKCQRCGADLGSRREYRDARTEPELFWEKGQ